MKFIKGLFLAFVFSCIFAVSGANAVTWFKAYGDIQIPALQGIWGSNDYTKMSDGYQHLETIDSKNPSMKTERTVQARTRHMVNF